MHDHIFPSRGLPARAFTALAFAFAFMALGTFELVSDGDVFEDLVGLECIVMAIVIAASCAIAACSSLELRRLDDAWLVTRRCGTWTRQEVVFAREIERVEHFTPPGLVKWPSLSGPQLVVRTRAGRLLSVAAGLWLPREVLDGLRDLLSPPAV